MTKPEVYRFMLNDHGELMTVGKGSRKKIIKEPSMWAEYNRWLREKGAKR